jgi:hypothetical protein
LGRAGPADTGEVVAATEVRNWHFSDMAFVLDDVRSWGAKRKLSALSEYFAF